MNIQGFPGCCGAAVFSQMHLPSGHYNQQDPNLETKLKHFLERGIGPGVGSYGNPGWVDERKRHIAIVITVSRQTQAIALIKKYKGKAVAKFVNQNTGATNTVWLVPTQSNSKFSRVSR